MEARDGEMEGLYGRSDSAMGMESEIPGAKANTLSLPCRAYSFIIYEPKSILFICKLSLI